MDSPLRERFITMRKLLYAAAIVLVVALVAYRWRADAAERAADVSKLFQGKSAMVYVRVIGQDGKLTEPVVVPKVVHTDEEWKKLLTPEQYIITRNKGTEPAFCGGLLKNHEPGVYVCVNSGLPLFLSGAKFESGTGWPSFFQP